MIPSSRTVSLFVARVALGVLVLAFVLLSLWTARDLWGQAPGKPGAAPGQKKKPRVEEEEDAPKTPPKRKVIRVEEEEDPKAKPGPTHPSVPAAGDLRQLAQQAKHKAVQRLFRDLAVPHDHVIFNAPQRVRPRRQREEDVEPISAYIGSDPLKFRKLLTLHPLDSDWKPGKPYSPTLESIKLVEPYERVAVDKVREFLQEGFDRYAPEHDKYLSSLDMLVAAEQALSAVLRWHESARETGQRDGEAWSAVESELRKQLLDEVLLKQMEKLAAARDWDRVLALMRRLAVTYTSNTERARIAQPVADLLKSALNDPTGSDEKKQEARKRLHLLEEEFPNNPVFRPIGAGLRDQAQRLLDAAKELGAVKGDKEKLRRAMDLLRQAEEFWPQLPGLHAYKIELGAEHPVLRVGVRGRLPKYFSPARACTDTERRAMEMLFESLVKLSPDDAGIFRYRLGLAERRPGVVPLGRQFQLPRNAAWSNGNSLDSGDIRYTVQCLKQGVGTGRSCAWGELLDKVEVKGDPFQVTLRLHRGHVDPLALMTFKVLPQGQAVDSEKFAESPVCSGPFRIDPSRHSDERRREGVFFLANPSYGSRPGKRDLPRIQEVRIHVCTDPLGDLRKRDLDLVLDLTAKEAAELRQQAGDLQITVPLPSATTPNRRIYFLAVNQRRVPDAGVRKALAHAINRELLLDKHFRGPLKPKVHKALNSPFPAGSWACNPAPANPQDRSGLDLYDADLARLLCKKPSVRSAIGEGPLKLKYPEGDTVLEEALKELRDQVKETTGIVLELVPRDSCQLREDVEQTQSYDLAYYHYDFPDETYWLWPLLGRSGSASADSDNFLNFKDDELQPLLRVARGYRDFAQMRKCIQGVHKLLHHHMPLIPLWQLDPLMAYHNDVKPVALDPLRVFTNVEEWRLRRK